MDGNLFLNIDELLSNWDDKKIGTVIKNIREETTGLTQIQFAELTNMSRSSYCNLENGVLSINYKKILLVNQAFNEYYEQHNINKKDCLVYALFPFLTENETKMVHSANTAYIADYLEKNKIVDLYEQLSETDKIKIVDRMENIIEMYSNEYEIPTKTIPLIGSTACGDPIEAIENTEDFVETNELRATFALKADGNSMSPLINDGDIILVKQTKELNIGEIGIFQINKTGFTTDEKVTCKLLKNIKDGIVTLTPMNPSYDPIIINAQNEDVKIIGKYLSKLN